MIVFLSGVLFGVVVWNLSAITADFMVFGRKNWPKIEKASK